MMLISHEGNEVEVSAVPVPRPLMREVAHVFKNIKIDDAVVAVPTCQRSRMELVNWGEDAAVEKDRLLEVFAAFGKHLCEDLAARGHWADYIDPCSGLPTIAKDGTSVYDEVAGVQALLKYDVSQAGPCKILLHPKWGSAVYPATCFTTAPQDVVTAVLGAYRT
ncbi:hypothetical protein CTAYLR_001563 [Chrysophaeum taylorii]|uniref:Methylmalonic aciduria and homocystinuria type D protein n=1 Tax=Chrysophaeum taylorii TaxID=2483200 RepID=A0AAD7UFW0_9STRA|nr:hypothetical protein CTAYLR_001563 [Chrysophaeum taylorii]